MYAHEVVNEVVWRSTALQCLPESLVVAALEQGHNVVVLQPPFTCKAINIANKATGVVAKTIARLGDVQVWVKFCTVRPWKDGSQVDLPVLEGTGGHASSTSSMGNLDQGIRVQRNASEGLVLATRRTLSRDGRL